MTELLQILDKLEAQGWVCLLKWDGERDSKSKTVVVSKSEKFFRGDFRDFEQALASLRTWLEKEQVVEAGMTPCGESPRSAFAVLDWSRFDVWATIAEEGVAVVESAHRESCLDWLRQCDYGITSIDFALGIGWAVAALGERLRWEEQFGYRLTPESRNLDALRDGFDFHIKPSQGHVLELLNADVASREDREWLSGLLAIAHEHSRQQLAIGARFFAVLILNRGSPLIGTPYGTLSVPVPYWTPASHGDPFGGPRAS